MNISNIIENALINATAIKEFGFQKSYAPVKVKTRHGFDYFSVNFVGMVAVCAHVDSTLPTEYQGQKDTCLAIWGKASAKELRLLKRLSLRVYKERKKRREESGYELPLPY